MPHSLWQRIDTLRIAPKLVRAQRDRFPFRKAKALESDVIELPSNLELRPPQRFRNASQRHCHARSIVRTLVVVRVGAFERRPYGVDSSPSPPPQSTRQVGIRQKHESRSLPRQHGVQLLRGKQTLSRVESLNTQGMIVRVQSAKQQRLGLAALQLGESFQKHRAEATRACGLHQDIRLAFEPLPGLATQTVSDVLCGTHDAFRVHRNALVDAAKYTKFQFTQGAATLCGAFVKRIKSKAERARPSQRVGGQGVHGAKSDWRFASIQNWCFPHARQPGTVHEGCLHGGESKRGLCANARNYGGVLHESATFRTTVVDSDTRRGALVLACQSNSTKRGNP